VKRKLNFYFDVKREKQFITISYVGIDILEIDLRFKLYVTNFRSNMFPRINSFLRRSIKKLDEKGYKDIDKVRIVISEKEIIVRDGKQVIRKIPKVVMAM